MSELSETLKRARLTFMHASDFIVSLYEGAYTIAEEISDRMAEERNLYRAPLLQQIKIESEIGAAVAFSNKLLPAFLVLQMSLLEDWLLEICQIAAQQENVPYPYEGSDRFAIQQAKSFFEEQLGLQFPQPWAVWEKLLVFQRLRDGVVNRMGMEMGEVQISDSYLVEVNRIIVSFLDELQTYMPEAPE